MTSADAERHDSHYDMRLRPVGVVRSQLQRPSFAAGGGGLAHRSTKRETLAERHALAELVIDEDLDGILDGIEGFSHLLVTYWAHLVPPEGRSLIRVRPMGRKDLPLTGIFATCSPARPNPLSVTAVRLVERRGNVLLVEGLEALDGSPVLDIKPYVAYYYAASDVEMPEWAMAMLRIIAKSEHPDDPPATTRQPE